jgi:hypothetical protein
MNNLVAAFITLVIMLFVGIGILIVGPANVPIITSHAGLFAVVMTLASAFMVIGLVGLAVIGFIAVSKEIGKEETAS